MADSLEWMYSKLEEIRGEITDIEMEIQQLEGTLSDRRGSLSFYENEYDNLRSQINHIETNGEDE
ncbi:MAG: hypothetical protein WC091_07180 [Sulfuricellaceae bacterium]